MSPATNVSDHLPVEITISLEVGELFNEGTHVTNFIPWSSLTDVDLEHFREEMYTSLMDVCIPFNALNHNASLCDDCSCHIALEKFYTDIVLAIDQADHFIRTLSLLLIRLIIFFPVKNTELQNLFGPPL